MTERVRYGRIGDTRVPKNTLVTVRKDDTVYFGIARCRVNADKFAKDKGVELAKLRANIAQQNPTGDCKVDGTLSIHRSGVFGQVDVTEIKKLLTYFDNIDTLSVPSKK